MAIERSIFNFGFPAFCDLRQLHADRDGGSGCKCLFKTLLVGIFFQMNCFLDQFSMLQGERGENHKALLSQESIHTSATLTTSVVLHLGSVKYKEEIEQALVS